MDRGEARRGAALLALTLAVFGAGCREPRKPLPRQRDAGPSVELVARVPAGGGVTPALGAGPSIDEHEPDDDRDHAQPLEAGKGLTGSLDPPTRGESGKGDDDWYSYLVQPAPGEATPARVQALGVELTGAADLVLEVYDGDGRKMVTADERGAGQGEAVSGLGVELGRTIYLRVRTGKGGGKGPYFLGLRQKPAPAGSETEPNDAPEQATLASGEDLSGVLSSKRDEDWFAVPVGGGPDGGAGSGTAEGSILRVELQARGVTPELRIESGGAAGAPRQRLGVVRAPGGSEELRLRNLGLPTGTRVVYVGLRAQSWKAVAAESRYGLRVTIEPPLEGAEREPNDVAPQVLAAGRRGGPTQAEVAGFLWPGDLDLFRVQLDETATVTWRLLGAAAGSGCEAGLEAVGPAAGVAQAPGKASGLQAQIVARLSGESVVRVSGKGQTCFDAPYRLTVEVAAGAP